MGFTMASNWPPYQKACWSQSSSRVWVTYFKDADAMLKSNFCVQPMLSPPLMFVLWYLCRGWPVPHRQFLWGPGVGQSPLGWSQLPLLLRPVPQLPAVGGRARLRRSLGERRHTDLHFSGWCWWNSWSRRWWCLVITCPHAGLAFLPVKTSFPRLSVWSGFNWQKLAKLKTQLSCF